MSRWSLFVVSVWGLFVFITFQLRGDGWYGSEFYVVTGG